MLWRVKAMGSRLLHRLCLALLAICLGVLVGRQFYTWKEEEAISGRIEWQLYKGNHHRRSYGREHSLSSPLQDVMQLQRKLQSQQLSCFPSKEGLFHKKYGKFLQSLSEYTAFHERASDQEGVRTLIWMCDVFDHCGGLADRLKGVTYALLLAMLSHRQLLLSWGSAVYGEQMYLRPNIINWKLPHEKYEELAIYEVFDYGNDGDDWLYDTVTDANPQQAYFTHLFSVLGGLGIDRSLQHVNSSLLLIAGPSANMMLATNLEPSALGNWTKTARQQWIIDGLERVGLGGLSPLELDGIVGIVFRYLFQFTEELLAEVADARNVLDLGGKYVAVHVRTGFAGELHEEIVDHPKLVRKLEDWERVLQCGVEAADRYLGKNSHIFLATDSFIVKHLALTKYGERYRTLDNTLLHLDRMEKHPHYPYPNETEGTLSTWVDFLLLAESYVQVRTDSGYAFVAGELCSSRAVDGLHCTAE